MAVNISGLRRNIKNVAHNYTDAQVKVREATSNDPWGPSSTMMSEIADLTYNVVAFSEIMQMVWKRLNDQGKNWRHVYKALVLLEYLIKTGSEKVASQCKENIFAIQTLKEFQYLDDNKDQGINVREKAKALVALLKDDERLRNERVRALKAKERFAQSTAGIGNNTVYNHTRERYEATHHREVTSTAPESLNNPELEAARPQTAGEEELQLQLALAMSREEAEQEESKSKSDDMRLQLALQKSQQEDQQKKEREKPSNDLLDLDFGNPTINNTAPITGFEASNTSQPPPPVRTEASLDPWGMPPPSGPAPVPSSAASQNDPWGAPAPVIQQTNSNNDPWSPPATQQQKEIKGSASPSNLKQEYAVSADNDPWTAVKTPVVTNAFQQSSTSPSMTDNPAPPLNLENPDSLDLFSPQAQNQLQEFDLIRSEIEKQPDNNEGSPNPFDLNDLNSGLVSSDPMNDRNVSPNSMGIASGAKPKQSVKALLGEHSNLVNLDNLVSGNAQARNPFEQQQQNPFQVKSKKPPLTELMSQPSGGANWGSNNNNNITKQQPMFPSGQGDINPFF